MLGYIDCSFTVRVLNVSPGREKKFHGKISIAKCLVRNVFKFNVVFLHFTKIKRFHLYW